MFNCVTINYFKPGWFTGTLRKSILFFLVTIHGFFFSINQEILSGNEQDKIFGPDCQAGNRDLATRLMKHGARLTFITHCNKIRRQRMIPVYNNGFFINAGQMCSASDDDGFHFSSKVSARCIVQSRKHQHP